MSKTMAEVLADHHSKSFNPGGITFCLDPTCGWETVADNFAIAADLFAQHQQDMLTAAGFGLVADAKGDAWEEAAVNILTNDPLDYWAGHLPEGLGFQQAMSSWLKAHAAVFKGRTP